MAFKFTEYTSAFRDEVGVEGFKYTFKQILSLLPSVVGHLFDTLLGLDGTLGGDRYNYLQGPFGALLGLPFAALGYVIGFILQALFKAPSYLGYYLLDRPITWLNKLIRPDSVGANYKDQGFDNAMLNNPIGVSVTMALYTFPTNMALPKQLRGPFGFTFGVIVELVHYFVNRLAAVGNALVKYPVDHISDGINHLYSAISARFKKYFGKTRINPGSQEEQTKKGTSQLHEDQPSEKPQTRKRITRKKDIDAEILKKDADLNEIVTNKINLFAVLDITLEQYHNSTIDEKDNLVKKAYRTKSFLYHPDKQQDKSDVEKTNAEILMKQTNQAKTILTNEDKRKFYLSYYERNGIFSKPPINSVPVSTAAVTTDSENTNEPIIRTKIIRGGKKL